MHIAVVGCGHGALDSIYASIAQTEQRTGTRVSLVIICGDFQACRNAADLAGMACPMHYRAMQDFYKYYSGEKVAPILTIFVGGNHEASAHLSELFHGGWAAPNIYYMGHAGVVNVGGLRIAGLSGIFKENHYRLGHHEVPIFSDDAMRSFYHVRELDVFRLMQLREPVDVCISHDWPQHIVRHGDQRRLLKDKPFLEGDIRTGELGSPPAMQVLQHLQPRYWFAAHLHVKFAAVVNHASGNCTRFLSLSKVLPNHDFLQILDVPGNGNGGAGGMTNGGGGAPLQLSYDCEWLAVLRLTQHLHSGVRGRLPLDPALIAQVSNGRNSFTPSADEMQAVRDCAAKAAAAAAAGDGDDEAHDAMAVPLNFVQTAQPYTPGESEHGPQAPLNPSPQTDAFIRTFELERNFRHQRGATLGSVVAAIPGGNGGGSSASASSGPPPHQPQQPPRQPFPPPPPPPGCYGQPPPAYGYYYDPAGYAPPPPQLPPPPSQNPYYGGRHAPLPPPAPPPAGAANAGGLFSPLVLDEEIDIDDD